MRCTRCGGYAIDMLRNGRGRCRSCGLEALPQVRDRYAGIGRAVGILGSIFLVVVTIEVIMAFFLSGGSRAAIAVVLVGTGIAALMGAGFIAAFGTMPHRTGGGVSLGDERRRKAENLQLFEPVGIVALFGVALIAVGLLVGLPGLR